MTEYDFYLMYFSRLEYLYEALQGNLKISEMDMSSNPLQYVPMSQKRIVDHQFYLLEGIIVEWKENNL